MRCIILGAGITGLTAGHYLKKFHPGAEVVILEKSHRAGGWLRTEKAGEFLFEKGPRSIRLAGQSSDVMELIRDLNLEPEVIYSAKGAKKRFVWHEGILHLAPASVFQLISSPLTRALLPTFLLELFKKPGRASDESIFQFISRRYSPETAERLIDPLTACIYGGDIHKLSVSCCFPMLKELEQQSGSLLKGIIKNILRPRKTASGLMTFSSGIEALPKAILNNLTAEINLNTEASKIASSKNSICVHAGNGQTFEGDYVISTIPPEPLAKLTDNLDISIPSASLVVVNMGWNSPVLKQQGFGCVFPSRAGIPLLGIVWDSSAFPDQNTHKDQSRLTLMLGGTLYGSVLDMDDLALEQLCLKYLGDFLDIRTPPDAVKIYRARNAIPQYPVGYPEKISRWKSTLCAEHPRLLVTGTPCDGVAVAACISNGKKIAQFIAK